MGKPILCVDFDGVIHSYTSGWQGATTISDPVTPGFFEWLDEASQYFDIQVYSSRSKEPGAVNAMIAYITAQRRLWREAGGKSPNDDSGISSTLSFPTQKPAAFMTIDDRAYRFEGKWPDPKDLLAFRSWNKR